MASIPEQRARNENAYVIVVDANEMGGPFRCPLLFPFLGRFSSSAPSPARYPPPVTSRDTTPQARRAQIEALRRLGPVGRIAQALDMSDLARRIAVQGWLDRHPDWSAARARAQVLRRALGDELYEAAYGSDPR